MFSIFVEEWSAVICLLAIVDRGFRVGNHISLAWLNLNGILTKSVKTAVKVIHEGSPFFLVRLEN
jgi:hypothetical protein